MGPRALRSCIVLCVLLLLAGCSTVRTDIVKPSLDEEIKWTKMLDDWSVKAYASRDFRAGFLQASTKPWLQQMPVVLTTVIADIVKAGNPDAEEFKAGTFGGNTLALYGILAGQGVRWLVTQLVNLNLIPAGITGVLFGG